MPVDKQFDDRLSRVVGDEGNLFLLAGDEGYTTDGENVTVAQLREAVLARLEWNKL